MRPKKYREDFIVWEGDSGAFSFPQSDFDFTPENMTIVLSGFLSRIKYEHQGAKIHENFKKVYFAPQYDATPSSLQSQAIPFKIWTEGSSIKKFVNLYSFLSPETIGAPKEKQLTAILTKMEIIIKQSRNALKYQFYQERMRVEVEQGQEETWYENLPEDLKTKFSREAFSTFWENKIINPASMENYEELHITPYRDSFGHLVSKPTTVKEFSDGEIKEKIDYLQWVNRISHFLNSKVCPNAAMRVYGVPREFYRGWKPQDWEISSNAKLYPVVDKTLSGENVEITETYLDRTSSLFSYDSKKICFGGIANEFPIFYKGKKDTWLVLRECVDKFPPP